MDEITIPALKTQIRVARAHTQLELGPVAKPADLLQQFLGLPHRVGSTVIDTVTGKEGEVVGHEIQNINLERAGVVTPADSVDQAS